MAIKYLAGERLIGTATERAAMTTSSSAIPQTSWKVIARATISGGDNSVIDTGTGNGTTSNCVVTENTMYATPKENLMVFINQLHKNGSVSSYVLFNNDTSGTDNSSGQYAFRTSENGETDQASGDYRVNQNDGIRFDRGGGSFTHISIKNILNKEKLGIGHCVTDAEPPQRWEAVGKWVGTAQINRISVRNEDGGDYSTGDEILVLGCNNDEANTGTNFWQELDDSDTLSNSNDTLNTGTFAEKKYLYVQFHANYTGDGNTTVNFNSDSSGTNGVDGNYTQRNSWAGGTDGTSVHQTKYSFGDSSVHDGLYAEMFIFNGQPQQKLILTEQTSVGSTGNTAPNRAEQVARWDNTAGQITSIQFNQTNSGSYTSARVRVWGSD